MRDWDSPEPLLLFVSIHVIRGFFRSDYARNPERTAQVVRARGRTRQSFPSLIDGERQISVYEDVAVAIFASSLFYANHLMPAVHAADRIGMHRKSDVLMNAGVAPPHAFGLGIRAVVGRD